MKFSSAVFVALMATLQGGSASNMGVRFVLNGGMPIPGEECTGTEVGAIEDVMYNAIAALTTRRGLRTSRRTTNCSAACAGWAPGTCFIQFGPGSGICMGWRRLDEVDGTAVDLGIAEVIPVDTGRLQAHARELNDPCGTVTTLALDEPNDSGVYEYWSSNNAGSATALKSMTSSNGGTAQPLLKFDLSGIPADAVIDSASLKLYTSDASSGTIAANRMIQAWDPFAVSWNSLSGGVTTDGVQAEVTPSFTFQPSAANTFVSFDVQEDVGIWSANPTSNQGWAFLNDGSDSWEFYARNFHDTSKHPELTISYHVPCPAVPQICSQEVMAVLGALMGGVPSVSTGCNAFLEEGMEISCIVAD